MMEICPTFLVKGEHIVEVYYTDWFESGPGHWNLGAAKKFEIPEDADTLVVELPIGCFEIPVGPTFKGDSLTLTPSGKDGGIRPRPCHRPRRFVSELESTLTA